MNFGDYVIQLAPELILLIGACVTLLIGVTRASLHGPWVPATTLLVILLALLAAIALGDPAGTYSPVGLWLTSLTFYTRWIALGIGALVVLVNWHQPVVEERGEYMAMILFSLLGVLLTASANDLVVLFFAVELVSVQVLLLGGAVGSSFRVRPEFSLWRRGYDHDALGGRWRRLVDISHRRGHGQSRTDWIAPDLGRTGV